MDQFEILAYDALDEGESYLEIATEDKKREKKVNALVMAATLSGSAYTAADYANRSDLKERATKLRKGAETRLVALLKPPRRRG